jgi:hypothetical protein
MCISGGTVNRDCRFNDWEKEITVLCVLPSLFFLFVYGKDIEVCQIPLFPSTVGNRKEKDREIGGIARERERETERDRNRQRTEAEEGTHREREREKEREKRTG